MAWAYEIANDVVQKEQEWNKQHYDHKIRCTKLMVGDTVLLQCTTYRGKHKIHDRWEDTVYEVTEQPFKNMPVFKIKSWGGDSRVKIVHRNLLLPLLSNPLDCAGAPDNNRCLVNPKETMGAWVATAASAMASHVHYLGACEGVQATNIIWKGLNFVTALFQKY